MTLYIKGTDTVITGTSENLSGVAVCMGLNDDGTIAWEGTTEVDWNEQTTVIEAGMPVWVDENGGYHHGVEVEDRRADGSVVAFVPFENDDLDELADLLNRVVAKATTILAGNPHPMVRGCAEVALRHATNCSTGAEKVRAMIRGEKEEVTYVTAPFTAA